MVGFATLRKRQGSYDTKDQNPTPALANVQCPTGARAADRELTRAGRKGKRSAGEVDVRSPTEPTLDPVGQPAVQRTTDSGCAGKDKPTMAGHGMRQGT